MPFGFCIAPTTFQQCMMSIFSNMVEDMIKVFMDDFYAVGNLFDSCLMTLVEVLKRCEECNLVLNCEECNLVLNVKSATSW